MKFLLKSQRVNSNHYGLVSLPYCINDSLQKTFTDLSTIFKRETKIKKHRLKQPQLELAWWSVVQNRPFNAGMQVLNLVKTHGLETHAMGQL